MGADRDKRCVERRLGPLQAHIDDFDLHARLAIATEQAGGVGRLEKLVRSAQGFDQRFRFCHMVV